MLDQIAGAGSALRTFQERLTAGAQRLARGLASSADDDRQLAAVPPSSSSDHPSLHLAPQDTSEPASDGADPEPGRALAEQIQNEAAARAEIVLIRSFDQTLGTVLDLFG